MQNSIITRIILRLLNYIPFSARLTVYNTIENLASFEQLPALNRHNCSTILHRLKTSGLKFKTVIDVGAYHGEWSKEAATHFPAAEFVLFEPQSEKVPIINARLKGITHKVKPVLLGKSSVNAVPFFAMETGSSVKEELTEFPRSIRHLPMSTLDEELSNEELNSPILMKLDVQGMESEVIEGGTSTLQAVDVLIVEVPFLLYNKDASLAHQLIPSIYQHGFVIFDFADFIRKDDYSLTHADIVFIKEQSPIRHEISNFKKPFSMQTTY